MKSLELFTLPVHKSKCIPSHFPVGRGQITAVSHIFAHNNAFIKYSYFTDQPKLICTQTKQLGLNREEKWYISEIIVYYQHVVCHGKWTRIKTKRQYIELPCQLWPLGLGLCALKCQPSVCGCWGTNVFVAWPDAYHKLCLLSFYETS